MQVEFEEDFVCDEAEVFLRHSSDRLQSLGLPIRHEIRGFGNSMNFYSNDPNGTQIKVYFHRQ